MELSLRPSSLQIKVSLWQASGYFSSIPLTHRFFVFLSLWFHFRIFKHFALADPRSFSQKSAQVAFVEAGGRKSSCSNNSRNYSMCNTASCTVSTWRRVGSGGLLTSSARARARARGARKMLAGWAAVGGARFHAARGRTPEWRREAARLLPRPTGGGAPNPPLTSVLPTLIPVEARGRRGGGGEILSPSLCQLLSLTSPSSGGGECASCASEKNQKLSEISSPTVCKVSEFFNTQRTDSVGASAWQASKPPSPCKLTPKLPPPDARGVAVASPRPVTPPRCFSPSPHTRAHLA